jgi:hypothetical protein
MTERLSNVDEGDEYEFDPAAGLICPRCGERLDCSAVSCADCNACATGVFDGLLGDND